MSKCHVRELSRVYSALFEDAKQAYPTLEMEFERDLVRLLALVEQRGIRVYLVDLVAVGKHLDRCLADGSYKLSGLPLTRRYSNRVVIPKFLRGLYLRVFDKSGCLLDQADSEAILFLRQFLYAAKKYRISCTPDKVKNTVLDFVETDKALPIPEGYWYDHSKFRSREHPYEGFARSLLLNERKTELLPPGRGKQVSAVLRMLDSVSSILTTTLGSYDPREWRFRHGPGAISEVVGPTNKYQWYSWDDALESEYPIADFGYHSYSSWATAVSNRGKGEDDEFLRGDYVPHSRLIAVPKTYKGPRLIAAEPCSHQWCQQNVWDYFCTRVKHSWIGGMIPFGDQTVNQRLCLRGSRMDTLATVDLSAASDRVTCHVVGQFFRSNPKLLSCLRASRTQIVHQDLVESLPELMALRKFSTMGSACTFPVESLVFLGVALSCVLVERKMDATVRNIRGLVGEVAVFGDDIIIPNDSRMLLEDALEVLYFKVNTDKSFWTGRFRESCGVDSYDGVNVTPIYWTQPCSSKPESVASTVDCCNNFRRKWFQQTASLLASTLPKGIPFVAIGSGVFGLECRCSFENPGIQTRWNSDLQRHESLVRSLIGTQARISTNDDTALLQFFTEEPDPCIPWKHGIMQRPKLRHKLRWVASSDITAQR